MNTNDFVIKLSAIPTAEGFDMLAISAGEAKGHGITFSEQVLQEAVPLYESKPVFIDHAGLGDSPSVRNLAGTLQTVSWSNAHKGIQAKLIPSGPAADVLLSVRDAAKGNAAIMEAVGFSTVLNVQLNQKGEVLKIVRVKSVDVVIEPARGGKFLSVFNPPLTKGGHTMKNNDLEIPETAQVEGEAQSPQEAQQQASRAAAELPEETQRLQAMDAQLQESHAVLVATCEHLLTSGLSASRLPDVVQARIRRQFTGKAFKATELQSAISEAREEVAALTSSDNVQGPGRVTAMFSSQDQFRLAVEDLFGLPREEAQAGVKVHRLRGIQEAYLMATGDREFMGGFYPEFSLVTANFPAVVANVMNKMLLKKWRDLENVYGWWRHIVTIEHFTNLNQVTWVKTGTIASLPTVAERGDYSELAIGDAKETSDWGKYGGYVPLTIEAVLRDDLRAFTRMPQEAAIAGMRNISEQVAAIFTQNSGAGPTMADGGALFNATAQTSVGGHANLLTTALGTDYTAWNTVSTAMFKKRMMIKNSVAFTGKPQGIKPSICLVPADLIAQAESLFSDRWAAPSGTIPPAGSKTYGAKVVPIAVPEWTDATDWAAVIDPNLVPGIMIGEIFGVIPQIFSASSDIDPAMFANDESRIKVRQFLNIGVADHMPLHRSLVAG